MDAKLNSETHLKHYFFRFAHFLACLAYKFATSANMTTQKYLLQIFYKFFLTWVSKNAEFDINGNEISIKFCVFLYPYQNVVKKIFVGLY